MRILTHTYPNGLRAVLCERPGTGTVATKVFVNAGSRYDGALPGLAHCLEHLLFKGAGNRTSRETYAPIEAVGGRIDAQTAKEYVAISAVTGPEHHLLSLEVLSDLLLHPRFEPGALESELPVIRQELARRTDSISALWDLYDQTIWREHPCRHPAVGYESTLEAVTLDEVVGHYERFFAPRASVVAICGECDVGGIVESLGDMWHVGSTGTPACPSLPTEPRLAERRANHQLRGTSQTHLILGWPSGGMRHPDSYVLKVVERIMGAGGNSRLYREVREHRGLAYSVRAVRAELADLGHFSIYTVTHPESAHQAVEVILSEFERLRAEGVSQAELRAAQANYEGSLAVSFETNLKMAGIMGVETLLMGDFEPFEEAARRVWAVTAEDVLRVAQTHFDHDRYALASLGPRDPSGA